MTRIDTPTTKSYGMRQMPAGHSDAHQAQACAVRLIDRRTGLTPRRNNQPLVLISTRPNEASAHLMAGRDPAIWLTQIEPIYQMGQ